MTKTSTPQQQTAEIIFSACGHTAGFAAGAKTTTGDLEALLAKGTTGQVRLTDDGELIIPPLTAEDVPAEADVLRTELVGMLPRLPLENVHFYGTHSVDIDGELAQLDADGYRPLRPAVLTTLD